MTNPNFDPNNNIPPMQRRLTRSQTDKWIGGVLGGVGTTYNIDTTLIRVLFILATAFTGGALLFAYLIAWIVMPAY